MKLSTKLFSLAIATLIAVNTGYSNAHTKESQPARVLYGSKASPFTAKVIIALDEKQLPYNLIETLPLGALKAKNIAPTEAFLKASPLGKIPAYQEGAWTIADSTVITAYLDRINHKNQLYPRDAKQYAQTLWYEKYGDEIIAGVVHHKILVEKIVKPVLFKQPTNQQALEKAINDELPIILDYLEKELEGKQWINGKDFSSADIAIGTHFITLKKCDVTVSKEKWPNVTKYIDRLFARDSFKKLLI